MSGEGKSPMGLLVVSILLGVFAIGGGLWARHRPIRALQLSEGRGDFDGQTLRIKGGPQNSSGLVVRPSELWLAVEEPSATRLERPARYSLNLDDAYGSMVNLQVPRASARLGAMFTGVEVEHGARSALLAGGLGEAVSVSWGVPSQEADLSPFGLKLGALGVELGSALSMGNRNGGVLVHQRAIDLSMVNAMQETVSLVLWPHDLFASRPAAIPR